MIFIVRLNELSFQLGWPKIEEASFKASKGLLYFLFKLLFNVA